MRILMKKNIYQILIAIVFIMVTGCDDDKERLIVDDQVGFLKPSYTEAEVFLGAGLPYKLYIVKSGIGKQSAKVTVSVNETLLEEYNTNNNKSYQLLPADCYSIVQNQLVFDNSDYSKYIEVKWDEEKLALLQPSSASYALPIQMTAEGNTINIADDRQMTVVVPTLKQPYIQMADAGLYSPAFMPTIKGLNEEDIFVKVSINYPSESKVSYQIEVDEQLLNNYNTTHGTTYKMLPEDAYTLNGSWSIPMNLNEDYFKFTFHKKALIPDENTYLFGSYVLPIKITSVSKYGVDPDASYILYPISFQPDKIGKTDWAVLEWNTSSKEDEIAWLAALDWGPEKTIDNNVATFWGSKWTTPKPFPYYFIYDMGKEYALFRLGYDNPTGADAWRGNAKAGYVEVSTDKENWSRIANWTAPTEATRSISFDVPKTTARYIRFVITDAFSVYLGGAQMNISEFNAWGM